MQSSIKHTQHFLEKKISTLYLKKKQRRSSNFPYTCMFFLFHPSNKQKEKQEKKTRLASPTLHINAFQTSFIKQTTRKQYKKARLASPNWTWFFTTRSSRSLLFHSPCFSKSHSLPLIHLLSHILETLKCFIPSPKILSFIFIPNIFLLIF